MVIISGEDTKMSGNRGSRRKRLSKLEFFEFPNSDSAVELADEYGYLPYMTERYLQMFGNEETIELLKANDQLNPITIRINTLKSSPSEVLGKLEKNGYEFTKIDEVLNAYKLIYDLPHEELVTQSSNRKPKVKREWDKDTGIYSEDELDAELYSDDLDETGFARSKRELASLEWGQLEGKGKADVNTKEEKTDNKKPQQKKNDKKTKENTPSISEENKRERRLRKIYSSKIATLGSTHEYLMGKYYLQGHASMLPALYLNPEPDDLIIDMCAAPGSKTTQMAQMMENKGNIIATEIDDKRIKSLIYNLRRCAVRNTTVLNFDAQNLKKLGLNPSKILLDAPCSGEGVIRTDPSRKRTMHPTHIKRFMNTQLNLLKSAVEAVKTHGYIMYSTCSIAPEENEFIIQKILDRYPKIEIRPVNDNKGLPGFTEIFGQELHMDFLKARRYFPHIHDTHGFFYCLLYKNE
ncbi:MAG: NOL1/NOP2/sun family putative RNA methylase [Candidatus Lokiarchaeota archaeon]|nr:NOL1/NOP2/sun family putative RNA methylase [Candidatus Lokiarchaeota archaeon]